MKKLKFVDCVKGSESFEHKIHRHVYVTIERMIETSHDSTPLYWRLLDPDFSMVEIGIEKESGKFVSLAIPLYNGKLTNFTEHSIEYNDDNICIPRFSLDVWSGECDGLDSEGECFSYPGRCQLELMKINLRIKLFDEAVKSFVKMSDKIVFEFNHSKELISVVILGLSNEERAVLSKSLPEAG